jgi:hypothetical protein
MQGFRVVNLIIDQFGRGAKGHRREGRLLSGFLGR